jgi:hypothetical protein
VPAHLAQGLATLDVVVGHQLYRFG